MSDRSLDRKAVPSEDFHVPSRIRIVAAALGRTYVQNATRLWSDELGFSNWLHANIESLGSALSLDLVSLRREAPVGRLSADLLARLSDTEHHVIIENQVGPANHGHFGQVLTYAAHYHAAVVIWIASTFRQEYRQAIAWMNGLGSTRFYAVELRGDGLMIPEFIVVAGPKNAVEGAQSVLVERANESGVDGGYRPAPFAVPSAERRVSPGQLALNTLFEAIALELSHNAVFPSLRRPGSDRNYYTPAHGPVSKSEWSVVFTDDAVRIELVFNDSHTAIEHAERLREHARVIEALVGLPLIFNVQVGRAKQIVLVRRDLSFESRNDQVEGTAIWCASTLESFCVAVQRTGCLP